MAGARRRRGDAEAVASLPGPGHHLRGGAMPRRRCSGPGIGTGMRSEHGSGSVLGIAVLVAASAVLMASVPLGGVLGLRQELIGAADAAALAAADTASGRIEGDPCDRADAVAAAVGFGVDACTVTVDGVAEVHLSTAVLGLTLAAAARAGPPGGAIAAGGIP